MGLWPWVYQVGQSRSVQKTSIYRDKSFHLSFSLPKEMTSLFILMNGKTASQSQADFLPPYLCYFICCNSFICVLRFYFRYIMAYRINIYFLAYILFHWWVSIFTLVKIFIWDVFNMEVVATILLIFSPFAIKNIS